MQAEAIKSEGLQPYSRHIADLQDVPPELAELPIWCAWRLVPKPGKKPDKVPVSPATGGSAWRKDKATFCTTAEQAIHYAESPEICTGLALSYMTMLTTGSSAGILTTA